MTNDELQGLRERCLALVLSQNQQHPMNKILGLADLFVDYVVNGTPKTRK